MPDKQYLSLINSIAREYANGWFTAEDLSREGLGDQFTCDTLYTEGYLEREPLQELPELSLYRPDMFWYKLRKKRKVPNGRTENISGGSN